MNDINVIDKFTRTFVQYIDSGFGLLEGEVAFLTSIIVGIDIVLAGLFWAFDRNRDVIASLIKKVLYVGFFALILNNFAGLTEIIFRSFAGLGLASVQGTSLQPDDLLSPGFVASTGFTAAHPLLQEIRGSFGITDLFDPLALATTLVLLFAWLLVVLSFFILAIQLFITIIEFKLTTLAGYVLVPFALWKKSAFLAERVLGNVISAGIKLMVLAVIIGIGATLFADFTNAFGSADIEIEDAMVLVLAALSLVGLAIFAPGIAAGLVSGAPQLGAGAAIGTIGGVAAGTIAGAGVGIAAARTAGAGMGGAVKAASKVAGGATAAYGLGQATSGATGTAGVAAGLGGVARAGAGAVKKSAQSAVGGVASGIRPSYQEGQQGAWAATGGSPSGGESGAPSRENTAGEGVPTWARRMRREQHLRGAARTTAQSVKEGDRPGAPANPSLKDEDD